MTDTHPKNGSYESNLQCLLDVVERLESEKLGLAESLEIFERGIGLAELCDHQLTRVEDRIKVLVTDSKAFVCKGELPMEAMHVSDNERAHDEAR